MIVLDQDFLVSLAFLFDNAPSHYQTAHQRGWRRFYENGVSMLKD